MTLHCVAAGGFAISAEVIKLLFDASAFHFFFLLHTDDYVLHVHVILVVSCIIVTI